MFGKSASVLHVSADVESHNGDRKIIAKIRLAAVNAYRSAGRKLPLELFLLNLRLTRTEIPIYQATLVKSYQDIAAVAVKRRHEEIVGGTNLKLVGGAHRRNVEIAPLKRQGLRHAAYDGLVSVDGFLLYVLGFAGGIISDKTRSVHRKKPFRKIVGHLYDNRAGSEGDATLLLADRHIDRSEG